MATNIFEMAKKYYQEGLWSKHRLATLVAAGKLTTEEYAEITGGPYES